MGYLESLRELLSPKDPPLSNPYNSSPNIPYPEWPKDHSGKSLLMSIPAAEQYDHERDAAIALDRRHTARANANAMIADYGHLGDVLSARHYDDPAAVQHVPAIAHSPVQNQYSPAAPRLREIAEPEFAQADYAKRVADSQHAEYVAKYGQYANLAEIAYSLNDKLKSADVDSEVKVARGRNGGL